MTVERLYAAALSLYPLDYRSRFGAEMRAAFAAAVGDRRGSGRAALFDLLSAEAIGLVLAAARQWLLKLRTDPVSRARLLPDCRYMRPVGLTRAEWAAGLDYED